MGERCRFLDDLMGLLVGVGQVAHGGIIGGVLGAEGEGLHLFVAGLQLHFGKIDGAAVHSGGRAGLEPAQGQTQLS